MVSSAEGVQEQYIAYASSSNISAKRNIPLIST
jgi:hypothetical protein